jgi:hypothetical protein
MSVPRFTVNIVRLCRCAPQSVLVSGQRTRRVRVRSHANHGPNHVRCAVPSRCHVSMWIMSDPRGKQITKIAYLCTARGYTVVFACPSVVLILELVSDLSTTEPFSLLSTNLSACQLRFVFTAARILLVPTGIQGGV